MKAMIFAAGLGTRLQPLTLTMPKALVPMRGKPMLQHVIEHLRDAGFNDIVVNVHHFGEQIIDFLSANHNFGIDIHVSDERDLLLDTGGGILKAREWLDGDEPFLVHNADILTNLDLRKFYNKHVESGADATLLVKSRKTQRYLVFNQENTKLCGWINKSTGETRPQGFVPADNQVELAFGGVHMISPTIFDALQDFTTEKKFSIIPFYVANAQNLDIRGYAPAADSYQWFDVGKIETLQQAEKEFVG